ncbi:hypothetical protein [Motilibacter peucedani]|uniref:hypothetical protein n=1 Tax=Motilibacter peucedani TaxID=598650 RepID=UPI0011C46229|nr:hypothetical protein [Motilibacter peucedani]
MEKDFVQKAADVDVRVWAGYLRLDIEPYTALAIPDVVPAGEEWNALAAKTVVLDRVRLAAMIPQEAHLDDDLRPVSRWAEERLELMRAQE